MCVLVCISTYVCTGLSNYVYVYVRCMRVLALRHIHLLKLTITIQVTIITLRLLAGICSIVLFYLFVPFSLHYDHGKI